MIRRIFTISLLWLCFASLPAHAQLLKCDSDQLTSADSKALRKAIKQRVGQREVVWSSMYTCVNHNRARIWVDLEEDLQPDGSLFKFSVPCKRGSGRWTCALEQSRSTRFEVVIEGRVTKFELGLPPSFDVQKAKQLVYRASEVAPTMKKQQACDYRQQDSPDPLAEKWLRTSQDTFRFSNSPIVGSITEENGLVSLGVEDQVLEFKPDPADATKLNFSCWTFEVIVT